MDNQLFKEFHVSTISTGAPYAILETQRGVTVHAYDNWTDLTLFALWADATGTRDEEMDAGELAISKGDAALCDAMLARLNAVVAATTTAIVQAYDPARLRAPEVWPFRCTQHSDPITIYADRYYGFYDAGGVLYSGPGQVNAGGWATAEECVKVACNPDNLDEEHSKEGDGYWSTQPEDLGSVACCVLTGRQFVDQLYKVCAGDPAQFAEYGHWSEPEVAATPLETLEQYLASTVEATLFEGNVLPLINAAKKHASGVMVGCGKCDDDPALCAWHQECQHPDMKFTVTLVKPEDATPEDMEKALTLAVHEFTGFVRAPVTASMQFAFSKAVVTLQV